MKIFKILALIILSFKLTAQSTFADMENYVLSPNSIENGGTDPNDGHIDTGWVSGNCYFNCRVHFNVWDRGFAISNHTDSVIFTGGPYSLGTSKPLAGDFMPNGGTTSSLNYLLGKGDLIYSQGAIVRFLSPCIPQGISVSNTCFGFDAMKNGNSMNKIPKFGGSTGNDPDWFKIVFKKYLGGVLSNDSIEYFLADYRFSQNNFDYIVNTWNWVDLTSLGQSDSLYIYTRTSKETEIMTVSGDIVGATMFCVDNLKTNNGTVTVKEVDFNKTIQIFPNPAVDELNINLPFKPKEIEVYDDLGKLVGTFDELPIKVKEWPQGIYIVKIYNKEEILIRKFITTK